MVRSTFIPHRAGWKKQIPYRKVGSKASRAAADDEAFGAHRAQFLQGSGSTGRTGKSKGNSDLFSVNFCSIDGKVNNLGVQMPQQTEVWVLENLCQGISEKGDDAQFGELWSLRRKRGAGSQFSQRCRVKFQNRIGRILIIKFLLLKSAKSGTNLLLFTRG